MPEQDQDGSNLPLFYDPLAHAPATDLATTVGERTRTPAAGKRRGSFHNKPRKIRVNQVVDDLTQLALLSEALHAASQGRHFP